MRHKAINLAQGFPDFEIDPRLKELLSETAKSNSHQYMPSAGYPPLLEKIAALVEDQYGRESNPATEIVVTAGATQAIFTTIQALVEPGNEVIILDPAYDCYELPVSLRGAKPVHIPLNDDYSPDWDAIADAANANTKMLIINNPHNPSGRVWRQHDFIALEQFLDKNPDVLLLSDEVYEHITFEQHHISALSREKLRNRSITISSFGKSFHITGWKTGYAVAPEHLMRKIKNVHQYLVFSVNSIAQVALSDYMDEVKIELLGTFYKQKRDFFRELMKTTRFELLPCEGSYFQVVSFSGISDESDIEFTKRLVTEHGVAAIPLSGFYTDKKDLQRIRFCFAKEETTLQRAAELLQKI